MRRRLKKRSQPASSSMWTLLDSIQAGLPTGYTRLSQCPEIIMAVDRIADLISNMAIHLMENSASGDIRVVNELSKKLDISPCEGMTRKSWMQFIVRTLLLEGDGNAVVLPTYSKEGLIENLIPIPASEVSFNLGSSFLEGYKIRIHDREFLPGDVLHFVLNPDPVRLWVGRGYRVPLRKLGDLLSAGQGTKEQFMNGRYMPSVIVKVDGDVKEINSEEGKAKLLGKYMQSQNAGEPWVIPAELMEVQQITPLSLKDIAVTETIAQDKKTLASLIGVPSFILGEGAFNTEEYNNFIKDKILSIAKVIEQTLTKNLLIKDDWYFRFNIRSLYSNDMQALSNVGDTLYSHGIMTGNEVRDWMGLSPKEGLDELTILENYIPVDQVGNQKKLEGDTNA